MSIQLKRNDTKDVIGYKLTYPNNDAVNLTGASVRFVMGRGNKLITNAAAKIVNASAGEVEYTLTEADTLEAGVFHAEFEVTFSSGKIKTFPNNGYINMHIQSNLDSDQSTYIEDQIAYRVSDIQILKKEIQAQIDQAVINGDSSVEAAQARVESDGTTNVTLKARLDKKEAEFSQGIETLTSELAQKAQQVDINKIASAVDYGQIDMPSDFISLPCNFYRGFDGKITHDFDFEQHKQGTEIYVNYETGSDNTGDGTSANPYQRVSKALEVAAAGANSAYIIKCQSVHFPSGATVPNPSISFANKTIAIVADNAENNTILSTNERNLTWVLDGTNTYKATRSAAYCVLDLRYRDPFGVPLEVKHVTTLAECQATPNTWYTDNTYIWVHNKDGSQPTIDDFIVGKQVALFDVVLTNSKLYLENIEIMGGRSSYLSSISGDISSELVCKNTKFIGGNLRSNMVGGNALSSNNIGKNLMFNCVSSLGSRDGLNYHFTGIAQADRRKCLVLEYNCVSYNHGQYDTNKNNNCFTAHEGASVLRVGCIGYKTTGPVLADVNGCYTICIDCHMKDSLDGLSRTKSAYFFDNNGAIATGKAYLINSDGGGNNDSLNSEVGFELYIKGFRGIQVPDDLTLTFIN